MFPFNCLLSQTKTRSGRSYFLKEETENHIFFFFSVRTRVQGFVFPVAAENITSTTPEIVQRIKLSTIFQKLGTL